MSTIIESIEKEQLRSVPPFQAGDRVRVHFQVIEGSRTRTQVFEGVVIKRQGSGVRETFTVRKQSFGVGVERTFPLHSPKIETLEIAAHGDVRRAKLYYLRDRVGKAARVAERRWGITEDVLAVEEDEAPVDSEGTSQAEAEVEVTELEGEGEAEDDGEEAAGEGEEPSAPTAEAEVAEGDQEAEPAEQESGEGPEGEDEAAAESEAAEGEGEAEADSEAAADEPESAAGTDSEADEGDEGDQAGGSEADSTEDEASERDS